MFVVYQRRLSIFTEGFPLGMTKFEARTEKMRWQPESARQDFFLLIPVQSVFSMICEAWF
jgi:hypothetical protein